MDGGVFVEQGPPSEVFFKPKDERTKRFLRHILPEKEPQHAAELGIVAETPVAGAEASPSDAEIELLGEPRPSSAELPLPGTAPQPPAMRNYLPNPRKSDADE
jgi:hypothetical protein